MMFTCMQCTKDTENDDDLCNDCRRPRVVTSFVYPPIPVRKFDWCAYRDGAEESGNYGWGHTEAEAIADLQEIETEQ